MKIRDLLAVPFWWLAQTLDYLAVRIGGRWTAELMQEKYDPNKKFYEKK